MSLLTGLVSYHKFDETSGTFVDSHAGNDATANGVTHGDNGILNLAPRYDGINDTITTVADAPYDFERNQAFSIQTWVKVDTDIADDSTFGLVSKNNNVAGRGTGWAVSCTTPPAGGSFRAQMALLHDDGAVELGLTRQQTIFAQGLDKLLQVVYTYDGSETPGGMRIYVSKVSVGLSTGKNNLGSNSILNNTTLLFGRGNNDASPGPGTFLKGIMDEVGIWGRELTANEVSLLFNNGQALAYPFSPSEPVSARQDAIAAALGSLPEHFTGTATTSADEITFTRTAGHVKVSNLDATNTILVSLDDGNKFWSIGPNTKDDFFGEIARLFIKSNAGTAAYEVTG